MQEISLPQTLETFAAEVLARDPVELARIADFVRVLSGDKQPEFLPDQSPRVPLLFIPGLRTRPFLETSALPYVRALETHAEEIGRELRAILDDEAGLIPYGTNPDEPGDKAQVKGWDAFYLYRDFQPTKEAQERCPKTVEALSSYPVALEAYFSVLRPNTRIPRHTDPSNFVLATHLPLVVPPSCAIRIAKEERTWDVGRCLLLDTSFVHEAWNESDRPRVTLNIDTWHPDLSRKELDALMWLVKRLFPLFRAALKQT